MVYEVVKLSWISILNGNVFCIDMVQLVNQSSFGLFFLKFMALPSWTAFLSGIENSKSSLKKKWICSFARNRASNSSSKLNGTSVKMWWYFYYAPFFALLAYVIRAIAVRWLVIPPSLIIDEDQKWAVPYSFPFCCSTPSFSSLRWFAMEYDVVHRKLEFTYHIEL